MTFLALQSPMLMSRCNVCVTPGYWRCARKHDVSGLNAAQTSKLDPNEWYTAPPSAWIRILDLPDPWIQVLEYLGTFVPLLCYCCQYKRLIMYPRIPDPEIQDSADPGIQDPESRIHLFLCCIITYQCKHRTSIIHPQLRTPAKRFGPTFSPILRSFIRHHNRII